MTPRVPDVKVHVVMSGLRELEMKRLVLLSVAVAIFALLAGCRTHARRGAAWGALTGGIIGYNSAYHDRDQAALVGALIGSFVGHEIGEQMDREDVLRRYYERDRYFRGRPRR